MNKFAAAQLNAEGSIVSTSTFDTYSELKSALANDLNLVHLGGATTVSSLNSTIYAGATAAFDSYRVEMFPSVFRPTSFTAVQYARHTILHEIQHGKGVYSETTADKNAFLNR